jgi:acetyl esterase/lipase
MNFARRLLLFLLLLPGAARAVSLAMEDVVYTTAGGQKLKANVYFPAEHVPGKTAALPAVLCIHGGAWRSGSRTDMLPFAFALADKGFVAVTISYRLFDPDKHPDNVWPAQYDDAQCAVRWMRASAAKLGIDAGRIAAIGASAGGHLVALLGTTETRRGCAPVYMEHSSRVNAVIDVFGPADLTQDFTRCKLGAVTVQSLVDDFIGTKKPADEIRKAKAASSPARLVDTRTVPFLIIHGDKDPVVPVEQSRIMERALKKASIPCTYVELKGEGHGLGALGSIERLRSETEAFLTKNLIKK